MQRITDYGEYVTLVNGVKAEYSNSTLMKDRVNSLIDAGRLYYQKTGNGVLILVDEGSYYKGYYHWGDGVFDVEKSDKGILIEEPDFNARRKEKIQAFEQKMKNRGFVLLKNSVQLDIVINECVEDSGTRAQYLQSRDEYEQVLKLWEEYLNPMDIALDIKYFFGKEEYRNIIVKDDDRVVSTLLGYWNKGKVELHHLVTDSKYQGKGLATEVYRYLFKEMQKEKYKRAIAWIADNNIPSLKLHKKLGFKENGRTCLQYYLKEE